jgi:uncharacterized damage-inducible protein DinB
MLVSGVRFVMKSHFELFAAYNRWANARVYEAAWALSEDDYRRNVGVFFKSLHGTLNHMVLTDRQWLSRLTGEGPSYTKLDLILYDDRRELTLARIAEDDRITRHIESMDDAKLESDLTYANSRGEPFSQKRREVLAHFFNHQTHHRGHAHAILSIVTGREPPSLDMLAMQRGVKAPDMRALV